MISHFSSWTGGAGFAFQLGVKRSTSFVSISVIALLILAGGVPLLRGQGPSHTFGPGITNGANHFPDMILQLELQQERQQAQAVTSANIERKRELVRDSELLYRLASELNLRIAKADEEPSSDTMAEIKLIEKLAAGVKQKMKMTAALK